MRHMGALLLHSKVLLCLALAAAWYPCCWHACMPATAETALICIYELVRGQLLRSAAYLRHTFGFDDVAAAGPFVFG